MDISIFKRLSFIVALSSISLTGFASVVDCDTLVSSNRSAVFTSTMDATRVEADLYKGNSAEIDNVNVFCNLTLRGYTIGQGSSNHCYEYPKFSIWRNYNTMAGEFTMNFDTTAFVIGHHCGQGNLGPIFLNASAYTFNFQNKKGVMTVNGKIVCNEELKVVEVNTDKINAKEMTLEMNQAADYVFDDNYDLQSLSDVESYVKENKHLPGVPSAAEFSDKGMNVSEMSNLLLEKVEELTLHMIQMRKEMDLLKEENSSLKAEIKGLRGE